MDSSRAFARRRRLIIQHDLIVDGGRALYLAFIACSASSLEQVSSGAAAVIGARLITFDGNAGLSGIPNGLGYNLFRRNVAFDLVGGHWTVA